MGFEIGAALVAIGSSVMGAITGGAAMFTAGTMTALGATISGAVGGALVGAAVGGLTSAIMGGDIMQGVLFGAIGGAVTGGLSGYLGAGAQAGGQMAGTAADTYSMAQYTATSTGEAAYAGIGGVQEVVKQGTAQTIGGSLSKAGTYMMKNFGGEALKGIAGSIMKGKELEAMQKNKLEEMQLQSELNIKEAREKAKLTAKYGGSGGGGGGGQTVPYMDIERIRQQTEREKLAEQRRQFNVQAGERTQARDDLLQKEGNRQALFKQYKGRGQGVGSTVEEDGSVYEARQESALADVEGGRPLTGNVPAVAVASPELAQAMEDQALMNEMTGEEAV